MTTRKRHLAEALCVLADLGMPKAQQNERSALTLLALLNLRPGREWHDASAPLMDITPIMEWAKTHYGKAYAPNTRETVRRQTMHQLVAAGIALYNPDEPQRAVNSPKAVYQIAPHTLEVVRAFGSEAWLPHLAAHLAVRPTLVDEYAAARLQHQVPVTTAEGRTIELTPGEHSQLIRAVIEDFAPRFAPRSKLVYVGDTGR